jgi:hypothetical protein
MTGGDCDEVFDARAISSGATRVHAQGINEAVSGAEKSA